MMKFKDFINVVQKDCTTFTVITIQSSFNGAIVYKGALCNVPRIFNEVPILKMYIGQYIDIVLYYDKYLSIYLDSIGFK